MVLKAEHAVALPPATHLAAEQPLAPDPGSLGLATAQRFESTVPVVRAIAALAATAQQPSSGDEDKAGSLVTLATQT